MVKSLRKCGTIAQCSFLLWGDCWCPDKSKIGQVCRSRLAAAQTYLKHGGEVLKIWIQQVCNAVVELESMPDSLKPGIVTPFTHQCSPKCSSPWSSVTSKCIPQPAQAFLWSLHRWQNLKANKRLVQPSQEQSENWWVNYQLNSPLNVCSPGVSSITSPLPAASLQFAPGPQCEGGPKQCWTLSNKIRFIIHIPVGLLGFVSLYCWFQVSLLFCFALTLLTQTSIHSTLYASLSYVTTAQPLARALYVALFDLKPLKRRREVAVIYVL